MYGPRQGVVLLLAFSCLVSGSPANEGTVSSLPDSTSSPAAASNASATSQSNNATCPSRTANYITNTLPQQCLRTGRMASNYMKASNATQGTEVPVATTDSQASVSTSTGTGKHSSRIEIQPSAVTGPHVSAVGEVPSKPELAASHSDQPHDLDATATTASSVVEQESESPLDNANFLTFEDWKKQNLAKIGQSPEDIGRAQAKNVNRPRPDVNNALDTLGEESEIDLDFSGFGRDAKSPPPRPRGQTTQSPTGEPSDNQQSAASPVLRSKDAGKTCKERTNYASFDCAANVLKTNGECKSSSSILVENKDSYMLNPCSASNKFFIIELCNDILIDTVVLANYEFFSSGFRTFRISVSDRYPVKMEKWRDLGTFEARNTREIQAFLVENPLIWARYLRIELLTHYGSEYYCPVSLLRVHGTTMLEEFRHQEEISRGEDDDIALDTEVAEPQIIAQEPARSTEEKAGSTIQIVTNIDGPTTIVEPDTPADFQSYVSTSEQVTPQPFADSTVSAVPTSPYSTNPIILHEDVSSHGASELIMTCATGTHLSSPLPPHRSGHVEKDSGDDASNSVESPDLGHPSSFNATDKPLSTGVSSATQLTPATSSSTRDRQTVNDTFKQASQPQTSIGNATLTSVASNSTRSAGSATQAPSSLNATSATASASSSNPTSHPQPQPPTQESFFKSVHKRLQQLESNSTLSLQYIEEQSRILRDAFGKVERRQLATTTSFLSNLNKTVLTELQGFRQAYDQLWQSTVIELDGQKEQYQREMLVMSSRLAMMADELLWQKRIGIVQATLLLLFLILVLFSRSGNHYLEVPLMQQMVNRSSAALRGSWESPPNSASPDERSPVSLFRRKLWRSSPESHGRYLRADMGPSDGHGDGPEVLIAPPTPSTIASDEEEDDDDAVDDSSERSSEGGTPEDDDGVSPILDRPPDPADRDDSGVIGIAL